MNETGTILYIDDSPQLPAGFEAELRDAGYRLISTADPDEALTLVRVEEIDLVLAEVVLTSCNGISLLEEIRSYGGWPAEIPIIVLTRGERSPELYGGSLELGVKEFLTKPALKTELLKSVLQFSEQASEPGDVDPSTTASTPEDEASIAGTLDRIPIAEVLRRLRGAAASGVLTVEHHKQRKAFELRNGSVLATSAGGGGEAPEDYLFRRERINREQHQAIKERVSAGKGRGGEVLVVLGLLSEEEFTAAAREQAEEQLLETFRWTSGDFRYFPGKHVRADLSLEIDRGHAALLLEGARHWLPREVAEKTLQASLPLYVSRLEDPSCDPSEIPLSPADRAAFEELYGSRNVGEVLDSGDLDARTLYGLLAADLIVLHEDPVLMLLDLAAVEAEPEPEFVDSEPAFEAPPEDELSELLEEELEIGPEETPEPARREKAATEPEVPAPTVLEPEALAEAPISAESASVPVQKPSPKPVPSPEVAPVLEARPPVPAKQTHPLAFDAERALAELSELCAGIGEQDDFDILGITADISDAEVRYAYENLLDSLPSEAEAMELPELKDLAEDARKRIGVAFDRLHLMNSRKVYAQLRPHVAKGRKKEAPKSPEQLAAEKAERLGQLASRGLDAESWFRRGSRFVTEADFEQAVEAFGMAAHLDPNEGEYIARLGYAQFMHQPKNALVLKEALENIAKGIKLSPNREKPYLYLGKIFRENGAADRSRKMFNNALRIKPECHEALKELRLLDQQQDKGGKLFGRLKNIIS